MVFSIPAICQESAYELISDFGDLTGIHIQSLSQDKNGFLWVGTNEGLYRHDGYKFKHYETPERNLGSWVITTIFQDSKGQMWIGTRGGLFKYIESEDKLIGFYNDPQNPNSLPSNHINSLVEDQDHNIWIAFSKGGLALFNVNSNSFQHFSAGDNSGLLSDDISDLHVDDDDQLWIATWDHGINKLDLNNKKNWSPSTSKFKQYPVASHFRAGTVFDLIFSDKRNSNLIIGTNGDGLISYDKASDRFKYHDIPALNDITLYDITPFENNKALISTSHGIRLVNLDTFVAEDAPPLLQFMNSGNTIFIDKQGNIWVATVTGIVKSIKKKIIGHQLVKTRNYLPVNNMVGLCKQGKFLWIGTWGEGLYLKDETTGESVKVNPRNPIMDHIWDIKFIKDKNLLLVATESGLVTLSLKDMSFRNNFQERIYVTDCQLSCLSKNTTGNTWIGTWRGGLYYFDAETGQLNKFDKFNIHEYYVQAILVDRKNQVWVGTRNGGLFRLSDFGRSVKAQQYTPVSKMPYRISHTYVSSIFEDSHGKMWIGTDGGGINFIDPKTGKITWNVRGERNLASNTIKVITEDEQGDIWLSLKNSISRYDSVNGFINYLEATVPLNYEFSLNSGFASDSMLYFGNTQGYRTFLASDLKVLSGHSPQLFITDLKINNKSLAVGVRGDHNEFLQKPIYQSESIELDYSVPNFTLEFSSLNFTNPNQERYAYRMEGITQEWTYTDAFNRQVTYSNLRPGTYRFTVKAIRDNSQADSGTKTLVINIIPPFWQTLGFRIVAVLALIGLIYIIFRLRLAAITNQKIEFEKLAQARVKVIEEKNVQLERQNIEIQKQSREIQQQSTKLHEADQSKINFFANISHEFRTPLMLIIGPLTNLLGDVTSKLENEKLSIVHRNAKRLLRLMDQIMDISKIDAGSLQVELEGGEVIQFVRDIVSSFDYLAKLRKVRVHFNANVAEFQAAFDHDKIEKILYNLLSNAFKVTPPQGIVSIALEVHSDLRSGSSHIQMKISNTGIAISAEELPYLFTRFYRTKNYTDGTGIGLSLTKSLVELQGGTVDVKSEEKIGTTFYVTIPVAAYDQGMQPPEFDVYNDEIPDRILENIPFPQESENIRKASDPNAQTILVLEDDDDMRNYISQLLEPYHVIRTPDGHEAVKLASQHQPDLIISDMMMPGMDGYQFLRTIKSNPNVSHIPIILLTARGSVEARLQSFEEGADDYITKPFNEKILLARVKSLIEQSRKMKVRFSTDINLKLKEITITSLDEKFIQNLIDLVEVNMTDSEFGSDQICRELGIGRTLLYSKVKAITDLSVNEFIKTMRLKRAAVLLSNNDQNVNEVSSLVGFTDRSHFSRSFTKHFGVSPTQYQKENLNTRSGKV